MINFLQLIAIVACAYCGFAMFTWWTVVPFAVVLIVLFWMLKPGAYAAGARAGGMFFVRFFIGNVVITILIFGFGRLLATMFN